MVDSVLTAYLEIVFLLTLLICASAILLSQSLFKIAIYSGIFSIVMSVLYLLMAAPDVAMTESSIGALISTVMLIKAMQLTKTNNLEDKSISVKNIISFFLLTLFAVMMIYGFMELPDYGKAYNPVINYVSKYYINSTPVEIGIPSSVAAILASYRGFDTLGETLVIMIAGVIINFIAKSDHVLQEEILSHDEEVYESKLWMTDYIRTILLPLSVLIAFYIQVHGEISPGGGFQAGAVLSSIFIFYFIINTGKRVNYHRIIKRLFNLSLYGFLIYLFMVIYTAVIGGYFLEYGVITGNLLGYKIGIFVIEIGVGITVFSVLLMIFLIFEEKLDGQAMREK